MPLETYLGLIGATIVFCRGTIFAPIRVWWPAFLQCPLCIGVWVGLSYSLYVRGLIDVKSVVTHIMLGASVGLLSYLTYLVIEFLDALAAAADRTNTKQHTPCVTLSDPSK